MAKTSHRVFASVLAGLFLLTSVGTGLAVIWQIHKDNKSSSASVAQSPQNSSNTTPANQPQEGKLQGTKLENFTPVDKVDSLQKIDITVGTGEEVKPGATVTAHYTGATAKDGIIFQSSHDMGQPIEFPLTGVIKGWTDGVPGMKVGGKRRLLIPADQAYGASPPQGSGIAPNADLVFDIEITAVKNP